MTKNKSISRPLSLLSAPLVKSLLLFICSLFFTPSFLCADEGLAINHVNIGHPRKENNKAEISAMADNGTHALIVGTRIIDLPTPVNPPALALSRQVGWIKLITMATGLGDSAFNSAGNATKNIFEPEAPPDAGSIYVDLSDSDKINSCTSVVWDSTNSVFWVGCSSRNKDLKYLVYLLKVTTAGEITSYATTLGGGDADNKHASLGRQGSLILDDSNTSLVLVGHKGPGTTSSGATSSTAYSPYIAKFTISDAKTDWVPAYQADFSTSDSTATGHRAVAVVKVGDYYYSAYTHIGTAGVRIAKFAVADLQASTPASTEPFYFRPITPSPDSQKKQSSVTAMATDGSSVWITGTCITVMNYQTPGSPYILKLTPGTPATLTDATADFSLEAASLYLLNDIIYYQNQNQKKLILVGQKKTGTTEEGWILAKDISTNKNQTFLPSNCKGSCFYTLGGINQGVPSYGYVAAVNKMGFFVYQSQIINPADPYLDLNAGAGVTLPFFIRYGLPVDTSTSSPKLINQKRVNSCSVDWPLTFDAATPVTPKVTFTYDDETKTGEGEVGLANINCKFTEGIGAKIPDTNKLLSIFLPANVLERTEGFIHCAYGSGSQKIWCKEASSCEKVRCTEKDEKDNPSSCEKVRCTEQAERASRAEEDHRISIVVNPTTTTTTTTTTLAPAASNVTELTVTVDSFDGGQVMGLHFTHKISWKAGDNNSGYQIAYQTGDMAPSDCTTAGDGITIITAATVSGATSYPVTSIGQPQYAFRVCAHNASTIFASGTTVIGTPPPPPVIVSINDLSGNPVTASTAVATNIKINGTNFASFGPMGATVTIGSLSCANRWAFDTALECSALPQAAGSYPVVVSTPDGQTSRATPATLIYANPTPTVVSISPNSGIAIGGTPVTITGTGFLTEAIVFIGASACNSVALVGSSPATSLTCTTTSGTASATAVEVSVTNSDLQKGSKASAYTYTPPPAIVSITDLSGKPVTASTEVATNIQIHGTDLMVSGVTVMIGSLSCGSVSVASSSTALTCAAPAQPAGSYAVVVSTPDGQTSRATPATLIYANPTPTVVSITPNSGSNTGGTPVTITGTGFLTGATVLIGASACNSVALVGSSPATSLTCTTPLGTASATAVEVSVTNSDLQKGSKASAYTYISPPPAIVSITDLSGNPVTASTAVATNIQINGTDFGTSGSGVTVMIGSRSCRSVSVASSATALTCTARVQAAGSYAVLVRNGNGQTSSATPATLIYANPTPTVVSISPTSGSNTGGTRVTIRGTGFRTGATVLIGASACNSVSNSATYLTCTTTAGTASATAVEVSVTNSDLQKGSKASAYTYTPPPAIVSITDLSGNPVTASTAVATNIQINGTDFGTSGSGVRVTIGSRSCGSVSVASSATALTCTAPAQAAGSYAVVVSNPDRQTSSATPATLIYVNPTPTVVSISPTSGRNTRETPVTIRGTGFRIGATVLIGARACNYIKWVSATYLTCTTPLGTASATAVEVSVTNSDLQKGSKASAYTYTSP